MKCNFGTIWSNCDGSVGSNKNSSGKWGHCSTEVIWKLLVTWNSKERWAEPKRNFCQRRIEEFILTSAWAYIVFSAMQHSVEVSKIWHGWLCLNICEHMWSFSGANVSFACVHRTICTVEMTEALMTLPLQTNPPCKIPLVFLYRQLKNCLEPGWYLNFDRTKGFLSFDIPLKLLTSSCTVPKFI